MSEEEGLYGGAEETGRMTIIPIEEAAREPCKAEAHDVEIGIIAGSHSQLLLYGRIPGVLGAVL